MGFVHKTISMSSTEKDFIKAFVAALTSADSRITCNTNIDEQFANTESGAKVSFVFNIDNIYNLQFVRAKANSEGVNNYALDLMFNGNSYKLYHNRNNELWFYESRYVLGPNILNTRCWSFSLLTTNNVIDLWIGGINANMLSDSTNVMSIHTANFNAVGYTDTSENPIPTVFNRTDTTDNGVQYRFYDCFNYNAGVDSIVYTKHKPILNGTDLCFDFDGLYDCSMVPTNSIVSLSDGNYYALNSHTLAKI